MLAKVEAVTLARRVLKMSIFSGDRAWAADDMARAVIDLSAEVERLQKVVRDAAEILRLNGLVATANAALESL